MEAGRPSRILVYGVTGSGKTTFARRLSEKSGIPWHAVDDLTWEPGWVQVPTEEQTRRIQEICDRPAWILDHAYATWVDIPFSRADLIIGLDYPRWRSLGRLLRRTVGRAFDGKPICNGNRETWRMMLSRDSILVWHFKSFARKRARMRKWATSGCPARIVLFTHPRQADKWLETFGA